MRKPEIRVEKEGVFFERGRRLAKAADQSSDLYPAELLDDIERAYEEGLVDPGYIGFDDVKRDLAVGKDRILARFADNPHRRLVEDPVAEMGWWHAFGKIAGTRENHRPGLSEFQAESSRPVFPDQTGSGEDRQKRALSVRQRQEI